VIKDVQGTYKAQGTKAYEEIPCDMIFRSIGYKGHPLPGIPFDERDGIIPNRDGRVLDAATKQPIARLYVAGWIKRGPSGVIGTNKPDAAATVELMMSDVQQQQFPHDLQTDDEALPALLARKNVRYVTYADWRRIDQVEVASGKKVGKPREKLTTVPELLAAAGK
jgi:ferredoxin--NADP+ reductase